MSKQHSGSNELYVGYQDHAPASYRRPVRFVVSLILLIVAVAAITLSLSQKKFTQGQFEFGNQRAIEGLLLTDPVPRIVTDVGRPFAKSILLVGYGKFGARGIIDQYEKANLQKLDGRYCEVRGTLIYDQSKTLLELTDKQEAILQTWPESGRSSPPTVLGEKEITGEIIDPKCYFGVMKPGEGATHRACAIRCISGGIPPVLKAENEEGLRQFFILKGLEGEDINKQVLEFVADPVIITGTHYRVEDWDLLYMDPGLIRRVGG